MSTQKIANGMRLDEWVIEALESGEYGRIGPEVYAKGHLKKYASLLGISPQAAAEPEPVKAGVLHPTPIVRLELPKDAHALWPRIGTVAVAAVLAGGVFWWREAHQGASPPMRSAQPPIRPDAVPSQTAMLEQQKIAPEQVQAVPSAAPVAAATPAVLSTPARISSGASPAGQTELTPGVGKARLQLSFSADSWVDIRDYSGKRIYSGNGRANSVKTVAGMAPFHVHLGSASGVQLQLNDRAVAIGRQFLSGDEARFEAGADGVLRRDSQSTAPSASPHG